MEDFGGALDRWLAEPYESQRTLDDPECPECGEPLALDAGALDYFCPSPDCDRVWVADDLIEDDGPGYEED